MPAVVEREQSLTEENQEQEKQLFGAFAQVVVRRGPNIVFLSLTLPVETNHGMLHQIMQGTLYPEEHFKGDVYPQTFGNGDLAIMKRPGLHLRAFGRLLTVSENVVRESISNQQSESIQNFYSLQRKRYVDFPDRMKRLTTELYSQKNKARMAKQGDIMFDGAFEYCKDGVIGVAMDGKEMNLLTLAKYGDVAQQDQIKAIVQALGDAENMTLVVVDNSSNVKACAARQSRKSRGVLGRSVNSYAEASLGGGGNRESSNWCDDCRSYADNFGNCRCSKA